MSKKDSKNINFNIGNFKVLKSDIHLNEKGFIGFEDHDYQIVNDLNKSDISLAVKDNVYIGGSTFIGYDTEEIIEKIDKINSLNQEIPKDNCNNTDNNPNTDNDLNRISKGVYIKNESTFENDVIIENKLFVGDNVFFNKDIFMPNPYILDTEDLTSITNLVIEQDSLSFQTYKILLKNILDNTKKSNKKTFSSIKFFNPTNMFTQSIIPINKKFIFNKIEINTFLLSYIIYYQNKVIEVKPIMDTFILINKEQNIFKLTIDE